MKAPLTAAVTIGLTLLALPALSQGPSRDDDADKASLLTAIERQRASLAKAPDKDWPFGTASVSTKVLRETSDAFYGLVRDYYGTPEFQSQVASRFVDVSAGTTHFTGYYMPVLEARAASDSAFKFPLYGPPGDLTARRPYFSHADIEDRGALAGRHLEIAWVKSELDRYFLMVEGSGILRYAGGRETFINYAGQNGHPYASLGRIMIDTGKLPREKMSMQALRAYFAEHPDEGHAAMVKNPSYVFFKIDEDGPFGVSGIKLTPGRSIATDKAFWPPGAIAYIKYPKAPETITATASWDLRDPRHGTWTQGGRWVCDQDTGGAIKGIGRVDIYWGGGEKAAAVAGTLNGTGSLTYLLLKSAPAAAP